MCSAFLILYIPKIPNLKKRNKYFKGAICAAKKVIRLLDEKTNQYLLMNLINKVVVPLNDIVEWDRYALRDYDGFIFGWIKRNDNFYDFVAVNFEMRNNQFFMNYNTSSKKYSKEIAQKLSKENLVIEDHLDCKPASDIPKANLVSWQKKMGILLSIAIIGLLLLNVVNAALVGGANSTSFDAKPAKKGRQSIMEELDSQKTDSGPAYSLALA